MLQNIIVGAIILAALVYMGLTIRKKTKGGGCGCGCSGCDGSNTKNLDAKKTNSSIPPCCRQDNNIK